MAMYCHIANESTTYLCDKAWVHSQLDVSVIVLTTQRGLKSNLWVSPSSPIPLYKIQKLEIGSVICECASDTSGEVVFNNVLEAVQASRHKKTPRFKLTSNDLRAYKKLTEPLASYTETIELSDVPID